MRSPTDPAPLVVPVTRVTYHDGTQELFVKSLKMRVIGDQLEFLDRCGRRFGRHMKDVKHIDDVDVCYGAREPDGAGSGGGPAAA